MIRGTRLQYGVADDRIIAVGQNVIVGKQQRLAGIAVEYDCAERTCGDHVVPDADTRWYVRRKRSRGSTSASRRPTSTTSVRMPLTCWGTRSSSLSASTGFFCSTRTATANWSVTRSLKLRKPMATPTTPRRRKRSACASRCASSNWRNRSIDICCHFVVGRAYIAALYNRKTATMLLPGGSLRPGSLIHCQ